MTQSPVANLHAQSRNTEFNNKKSRNYHEFALVSENQFTVSNMNITLRKIERNARKETQLGRNRNNYIGRAVGPLLCRTE